MGFFLRICLLAFVCITLSACASTPKQPQSLKAMLEHPDTISLPLIETESDLLIVPAGLPDGTTGHFVVDTGATLTSIYADVQRRLGLLPDQETEIRIHGMIAAQLQPLTALPSLTLGQRALPAFRVAVIPRVESSQRPSSISPASETLDSDKFGRDKAGILGMDILKNYHLFIDKPANTLKLIPTELGSPRAPGDWDVVELTRNPFLEDSRELHFFSLRIGNGLTPALLDTGAEFNMMNWNIDRFKRLQAVRRKLRADWEIAGAIGTFKPVAKISSKNARAGQKFWDRNEFLVLDFKSLDVLGIDGKPFVIAGMPMLKEDAVLIDFESDKLYFAPDDRPDRFVTVK